MGKGGRAGKGGNNPAACPWEELLNVPGSGVGQEKAQAVGQVGKGRHGRGGSTCPARVKGRRACRKKVSLLRWAGRNQQVHRIPSE